jgi:hypothetical protein
MQRNEQTNRSTDQRQSSRWYGVGVLADALHCAPLLSPPLPHWISYAWCERCPLLDATCSASVGLFRVHVSSSLSTRQTEILQARVSWSWCLQFQEHKSCMHSFYLDWFSSTSRSSTALAMLIIGFCFFLTLTLADWLWGLSWMVQMQMHWEVYMKGWANIVHMCNITKMY